MLNNKQKILKKKTAPAARKSVRKGSRETLTKEIAAIENLLRVKRKKLQELELLPGSNSVNSPA